MIKPEQLREATDAVLSAGTMQQSIGSIRASINQLLDTGDCLYGLDNEDSFRIAWTIAASAGSLVSGVNAMLGSFDGLVEPELIDETRALIGQFGRHVQGSPAQLLADRDSLLAVLELKLSELCAMVREQASQAPAGMLLADSDFSALLG